MSSIKKAGKILLKEGPVALAKAYVKSREIKEKELRFRAKAKSFHVITESEREEQKQTKFKSEVTFSIITPLYNTPEKYLNELIDSLQRQTYGKWQLCLADGSDAEHNYVEEICVRRQKQDSRIAYCRLQENKGISANTNACLKLAIGEYYGLLDHDDILHESALYEMMKAIDESGADFLYTDEVKFMGRIEDAMDFNFKPGFGKDELRAHNYICHFTVFSKKLLEKEKELYRTDFDGSQDHDMVLRLTEKAERIVHIPKVLYYWRMHPNSVSMNLDSKIYAVDAAIRAVSDQLVRTGEKGVVASSLPYRTLYRINYDIPSDAKVCIFLYGYKVWEDLEKAKEKMKEITKYSNYEIVMGLLRDKKELAKSMNQCIYNHVADYYVFVDVKCVPQTEHWIQEMLMFAQRKDVCAVSPKVVFEDNTICFSGISLDNDEDSKVKFLFQGQSADEQGYEAMLRMVRNVTAVWKGCFMVSSDIVKSLGGFDNEMSGYEEIDFSLRGMADGLWNVWTPYALCTYCGEIKDVRMMIGSEKFNQTWQDMLKQRDVYLHPRLKELELI